MDEWHEYPEELQELIFAVVIDHGGFHAEEVEAQMALYGEPYTVDDILDSGWFQCDSVTYQRWDSPTEYCLNPKAPDERYCRGCEPRW